VTAPGQILGGDHGRIIGAGDGDVDLLGDQPPLPSSRVMVKLSPWSGPCQILDAESATV